MFQHPQLSFSCYPSILQVEIPTGAGRLNNLAKITYLLVEELGFELGGLVSDSAYIWLHPIVQSGACPKIS